MTTSKIFARVISVILVLVFVLSFAACSSSNSNTSSTSNSNSNSNSNTSSTSSSSYISSNTSSDSSSIDFSVFPEVEPKDENLYLYRDEVLSRKRYQVFLSEIEAKVLNDYGYRDGRLADYVVDSKNNRIYNPVIYRYEKALILWYTDDFGRLDFELLTGSCNVYLEAISYVHLNEEEEIMYNGAECAYAYNKENGKISRYTYGRETATFFVPKGSLYCGLSEIEGFIFRSGTDVYAVPSEDSVTKVANCIAHRVKFVIDVDYDLGSDPWSQPLFLMEDGSVKAYVHWESDDNPADSPENLVDLVHEGGYHRGR